jgi:tRNA-2-methylthio-N6-dimethylallyladenosine synthase
VKEANNLVKNGTKEITLLGQNVNAYNYEKKRLSDLILEISKIKELKRIRYTTSHPIDFTDDLIETHKNCDKLMPMIHLPVQSGSNKILKAMNRKHTVEQFLEILKKLTKVKPNIKFSSDFIIGYPGETNDDFKKTVELMHKVKFINSFSFVFSARPGTPAFNLKKNDDREVKNRLIEFQNIAENIKSSYRKRLLKRTVKVLFENKMKDGNKYFGRDEYFNSVIVQSNIDLTGIIKKVKVLSGNQNTLFGEVASNLNETYYAA